MARFDTPDPLMPSQYRQDIENLPPLLTNEERLELCRGLQDCSTTLTEQEAIHDHLIVTSLRLVIQAARQFRWSGLPFADTVQTGNIGLLRGARRYDYTRGTFSNYVWSWILQEIRRGLLRGRAVYLPDRQYVNRGRPIIAAIKTLVGNGEPVTAERISELSGVPIGEVHITYNALREAWSLDAPTHDSEYDNAHTYADELVSDEPDPGQIAEANELWGRVLAVAQQIPNPLARDIIIRLYNLDGLQTGTPRKARVNMVTIGRELGFSREWIRQHHDIGMAWMRERLAQDQDTFAHCEGLFASGIIQDGAPRIL